MLKNALAGRQERSERCSRARPLSWPAAAGGYVCNALSETHREPMCLSLPGQAVDEAVVGAFFEAVRPAELDLLEEVLAERFEKTPPVPELDPALRAGLKDLGRRLPGLWEGGRLAASQKKELLRSLIHRVVLSRPEQDAVGAKVVWVSGAYPILHVTPPVLHRTTQLGNYEELLERILELAAEGHQDTEIARRLTEEGSRSARLPYVNRELVEKIRAKHGRSSLTGSQHRQEKIDGCWSVPGLALRLGTSETWLRAKIAEGEVPARRHPTTKRWLIEDDPALLARLEKLAAERRRR